MVDPDALPLADKALAGAGTVLVVDLLFLPWHSFEVGVASVTWAAVEREGAILGVGSLLLTVAVVALTLLRIARPEVELPDLPVSPDRAVFVAAAAVLGTLVLKLVLQTQSLGVGAWLGVLLAGTMALGGHLRLREAATGRPAV